MATLVYLSALLVATVRTEEVATPASLLRPRNFNHHAFATKQYLKEIEPTKQGPILFPNDSPPPPRPPLIVTSRPLIESISRSELNPNPIENNTIASSSSVNRVQFKPVLTKPGFRLKPEFLARVKDYKPFAFPVVTTAVPFDYGPYADVVKKARLAGVGRDNRYSDYEEQTVLPPIYKALSDHAKQKVLKIKQKAPNYDYQVRPDYSNSDNNDIHGDNSDYNEGSNYAFSYTVRDHKTGDDFSHSQQSSGSATNGEYRVRLPDGRMQIVSYTADENGYNADVRYDDDGDKTAGNSIDNNQHNEYNRRDNQNENNRHDDSIDYTNANDYAKHRDHHNAYDHNRFEYKDVTPRIIGNNRFDDNHDNIKYDYNDNNHDYVNREYKTDVKPVKEEYNQYSDLSKEYYNNDYSLEYDGKNDNYAPHQSKFSVYAPTNSNLGTIIVPNHNKNYVSESTVKPTYEELKNLFVTKNLYNVQPTSYNPVELNVPSTTPSSNNFDGTTEHVVVIGTKPNLYTNVRNVALTATSSPVSYTTPSSFVTPQSYLVSTIANLKDRINAKPVLSNSFIERINKYLTFK